MSDDRHHRDALIETCRAELSRAHAAALTMEAAEIRRGIELALAALREAATLPKGEERAAVPDLTRRLEQALADLDTGRLADLGRQIEAARAELDG